jgi:hypothetical protein
MLKVERKHECKSYFKNNDLFDSERMKEYKVTLFGWTIYKRSDSYNCDVKEGKNNNPGFKNETSTSDR